MMETNIATTHNKRVTQWRLTWLIEHLRQAANR